MDIVCSERCGEYRDLKHVPAYCAEDVVEEGRCRAAVESVVVALWREEGRPLFTESTSGGRREQRLTENPVPIFRRYVDIFFSLENSTIHLSILSLSGVPIHVLKKYVFVES